MGGYAATLGSAGVPSTFSNDVAAYFATFLAPVQTAPAAGTYASGATYNGTVNGTYLLSNTTYSATLGTISGGVYGTLVSTFSVTNLGSYYTFSGALPTVAVPTTYRIKLNATNANNATLNSVQYSITVNPPAPVISSGTTASGTVGVNATQYTIVGANSPTAYGLWVSSGPLPPGTSLVGASVVGTPSTVGTYNVWLYAENAGGRTYVNVNITIGIGNQTISFGGAPTVLFNGTGTVAATATSGLAVS
ncbi:MAG: hypothetical protein C0406_09820, partial [Sideroxydans sp.]|nr:hypothetical protein [Sideroxydans sp.]